MVLIHPPVAKPGEPPAGLAKIAGALRAHKIPVTLLDASLEGLLHLCHGTYPPKDTFSKRALAHAKANEKKMRTWTTYGNIDKYKTTVNELNKILSLAGAPKGVRVTFSDYHDPDLSPVRQEDLVRAAASPETNVFFSYFSRRLPQILNQAGDGIVGFSLNYLSQALTTFAMIGFVKQICPKAMIVVGGGLATSWASKPGFVNPFGGLVDHWVQGPGESYLLAMHGRGPDHDMVCPDFNGLHENRYLSPGFVLPYGASTGCFWGKCSFCPETAENNVYRPIPPTVVLGETHRLIEKTSPILVHFLDNALSPALINALVRRPLGVPWYGFARVSHQLTDLDFCRNLSRSGCVMLKLGLESGDQDVLDSLNKGIDVHMAEKVLHTLKQAGIATYVYLLFGTPSETLSQARRTLAFTVKNCEAIDFLNLAVFNLPVLSKECDTLDTTLFYDGDLSLYTDFKHPAGWHRSMVRLFLDKEFTRHKAVAPILRRDPPCFTSNHAPLFRMSPKSAQKNSREYIAIK